jgi:hypothetical protein
MKRKPASLSAALEVERKQFDRLISKLPLLPKSYTDGMREFILDLAEPYLRGVLRIRDAHWKRKFLDRPWLCALEDAKFRSAEFRVVCHIALHSQPTLFEGSPVEHEVCSDSIRKMMRACRLDRNTIRDLLREFNAQGVIKIYAKPGSAEQHYELRPPSEWNRGG